MCFTCTTLLAEAITNHAGQVSGALAGVCRQMDHIDLSQGHFFTCFSFNFHMRFCQTVTKPPTLKPCVHPTGSIQLWAVLYSGRALSVHHPSCGVVFSWDVQHYTRCFSLPCIELSCRIELGIDLGIFSHCSVKKGYEMS